MQTDPQSWPPEYRLRKSRRAKHLQLKICPQEGLEIVIPYRYGYYNLDNLLLTHRPWIEKKLKIYHNKVQLSAGIPTQIQLLMSDEIWRVELVPAMGRTKIITRPDSTIILMGNIENTLECQTILKKWLRKKAQTLLIPMLETVAREIDLSFQKISIREQKTRWGSCDSNGNISLNSKLIFLPRPLVRYIMIHELCHTRHLNHSKRFWALVAKFDPNYAQHRREINRYNKEMGCWGVG